MRYPNASTAMAAMVVEELVAAGVEKAVASPGSRSTALVLALDAHADVDLTMCLDERSAAFRALGRALASGRPALVVTTSGSAVANLAPAIAEAERAGVPLVAMTADRPHEMVERRANQTMDHKATLDGLVRGAADIGPAGRPGAWESVATRLVWAALGRGGAPGPVHLNVRFDEPTLPVTDDGRSVGSTVEADFAQSSRPPAQSVAELSLSDEPLDLGPRALVIAGQGKYDVAAVVEECAVRSVPILVSALSGGRGGGGLAAYHHVLANGSLPGMEPTGVLVLGRVSPADRLASLMPLADSVVHVDPYGVHSDPTGSMTVGLTGDPLAVVRSLESNKSGFSGLWEGAVRTAKSTVSKRMADERELSGPGIVSSLNRSTWGALVAGSSLSIRDVDAYLEKGGSVYSNRGVSGIDGFNSTALGVADVHDRTVGLVGDLSFLHDCNGYLTDRLAGLVTVIFDNNGGGLFDQLPQARHAKSYERLFVTPHSRNLSTLAEFHQVKYVESDDADDLRAAIDHGLDIPEPTWIHVKVDRASDLALRRELDSLVVSALESGD